MSEKLCFISFVFAGLYVFSYFSSSRNYKASGSDSDPAGADESSLSGVYLLPLALVPSELIFVRKMN